MNDRLFSLWFAFCAVMAASWLCFVMWTIYRVVTWLTV